VLYTPGEKNSEVQLKDLQAEQTNNPMLVTPVPLARKEDIADMLPDVIRTSALYFPGSNLVDSQVSAIADIATRAGVVTITHRDDLVEKGVLIGVCANFYQLGQLAGRNAMRILKGEKPSSIPIERLRKFDLFLNLKTANAGHFRIPAGTEAIV
jgi:putative tryptophan/tyrosine transport system substrate-binding protein